MPIYIKPTPVSLIKKMNEYMEDNLLKPLEFAEKLTMNRNTFYDVYKRRGGTIVVLNRFLQFLDCHGYKVENFPYDMPLLLSYEKLKIYGKQDLDDFQFNHKNQEDE